MDEVGCRLIPKDVAARYHSTTLIGSERINEQPGLFDSCVIMDESGASYTAIWPVRDIEEGDLITCSNLNSRGLQKLCLLQDALSYCFEDELESTEDVDCKANLPMLSNITKESRDSLSQLRSLLAASRYAVKSVNSCLQLDESYGCLLPSWDLSSGGSDFRSIAFFCIR